MSDYSTLRDAIEAKVTALVGVTLDSGTEVFSGMGLERFMQEPCAKAVCVSLAEVTGSESEVLGDAVHQFETWLWDVYVMVQQSSAHDGANEDAFNAMDALRDALCPATGWKPDAYSDVLMWAGNRPAGFAATGAVIWASRYRHWRNLG